MPAGCADGHAKSLRDLGVGHALDHQAQDVTFALCKRLNELTRIIPPEPPAAAPAPTGSRGRRGEGFKHLVDKGWADPAHERQEVGDAPGIVDDAPDVPVGRSERDRLLEGLPRFGSPSGRLGPDSPENADRDEIGESSGGLGCGPHGGEQRARLRGPALGEPDTSPGHIL